MASSEAMKRKRVETLPADFNDWDEREPPSTLPPDFREFDPSPEGEEQGPVLVRPVTTPVPQAGVSKLVTREMETAGSREIANLSIPKSRPELEPKVDEEDLEEQGKSRKGIIIGAIGAVVILASATTLFVLKRSPEKVPTAKHLTLSSTPMAAQPQASVSGEKPAAGKPVASDTPTAVQPDASTETTSPTPQAPAVDTAGMQSQLDAPSRISGDLKKPGHPEAPPQGSINIAGADALGGGNTGFDHLFSGKSNPQVRIDIPTKVNVSTTQAMGMLMHKVEPMYPTIARSARVSGTVRMQILVGKDGGVRSVRVVDGPRLLQSAAVDAVKSWRFRPYTISNQTVEMDTMVSIAFKLAQ